MKRNRINPWPKGKSRKAHNAAKKAWKTRRKNKTIRRSSKKRTRHLAALKAWRTRRKNSNS